MLKIWKESVGGVSEQDGLLAHRLFWLCVLGPIILAILLAWFYGLFSLPFERSLSGVSSFYENAKFFLAIAALSIPLGATFARIHGSSQTAENIVLSTNQNNFRNGIDHAQFFEKQLSSYCAEKDKDSAANMLGRDPYFYYKILFPYSMGGGYQNEELDTAVDNLLNSISEHCDIKGDVLAAVKVSCNIDAFFELLNIQPLTFDVSRKKSIQHIQKESPKSEQAEIDIPDIVIEHFYINSIARDLKSSLEVWKIGLDLVDHGTAFHLKQAIKVISLYVNNFIYRITKEVSYEKIKDLEFEQIKEYMEEVYKVDVKEFEENGKSIKKWVEVAISKNY